MTKANGHNAELTPFFPVSLLMNINVAPSAAVGVMHAWKEWIGTGNQLDETQDSKFEVCDVLDTLALKGKQKSDLCLRVVAMPASYGISRSNSSLGL